jgi:hypothetical protein
MRKGAERDCSFIWKSNQPSNQNAAIERIQLLGALNGSFNDVQKNTDTATPPQMSQFIAALSGYDLLLSMPIDYRPCVVIPGPQPPRIWEAISHLFLMLGFGH